MPGVSTAFGRLEMEMRNETMHRMSGSDVLLRFRHGYMPLIGEFVRSPKKDVESAAWFAYNSV
jgi:hypothetical protein